jgi:hypothetical protein
VGGSKWILSVESTDGCAVCDNITSTETNWPGIDGCGINWVVCI